MSEHGRHRPEVVGGDHDESLPVLGAGRARSERARSGLSRRAMVARYLVRVTTAPVAIGSGPWTRLLGAKRGSIPGRPGRHLLYADLGWSSRQAEAVHNAALANGFESQIVEWKRPTRWELNVRPRGSQTPTFLGEEDEFAQRRPLDGHW